MLTDNFDGGIMTIREELRRNDLISNEEFQEQQELEDWRESLKDLSKKKIKDEGEKEEE